MTEISNASEPKVRDGFVYLMFAASGASALIYQLIWARWLGLVFGNTSISISVVLACFMLGLALGSFWVGKYLQKIKNPMRLYAWIELAIGLFAVCFPFLSGIVDSLYPILVNEGSNFYWDLGVRIFLAFVLLLIPTTLMGATLPLLTDFFRRSPRYSSHWKVGLLYGANTIGAAIGTLIASFVMIELLGVRSTTLVAACLNFAVGLVALKMAVTVLTPKLALTNDSVGADVSASVQGLWSDKNIALWVLAFSGGIAMASEVLWTRAMEVLVGNSSYAFATILVVYLTGIAAGSALMSVFINRLRSRLYALALIQGSMAVWSVLAIVCFGWLGEYIAQFNNQNIEVSQFMLFYLFASLLILPLALLSGATFPVATRLLQTSNEDASGELIAKAYAWNTIGAVVGSLLAGFVIAAWFDYFQSIYLVAAMYCLVSLFVLVKLLKSEVSLIPGVSAVVMLILVLVSAPRIILDRHFIDRVSQSGDTQVLFHEPGLQGITSVFSDKRSDLGTLLLVNGTGMTIKVTDTKIMSHLPLLLHPEPLDTLVICFGMGTTYRSAIAHGYNVTVVELVSEVVEAFPYFHHDALAALDYKPGKIVINDGRNYLQTTRQKFDVITLDPPPPIDGRGVTNLHSVEFVELAKSRLKPGGIAAHWIPFPWAMAGVDDWKTFDMLVDSFRVVFPNAVMLRSLSGMGLHVLGSDQPIDTDMATIQARLKRSQVLTDINEWQEVAPAFFADLTELPISPENTRVLLTDDRPSLEFNLLRQLRNNTIERSPAIVW